MSEFLKDFNTTSELGSLKLAKDLSKYCHDGQLYGNEDYFISHVYDVALEVNTLYGDKYEEFNINYLISVAYLHDTLEDSPLVKKDLESLGFDSVVVNAVEAISKVKGQSYKEYIDKVKSDEYAFRVKICDTLCNLEASILSGEQRRIKKYLRQLELLL